MPNADRPPAGKKKTRSLLQEHPFLVACCALIGIMFAVIITLAGAGGPGNRYESLSNPHAYSCATSRVEQMLKAPSTADFPSGGFTEKTGPDEYLVRSYVDAENGFGAMIRSHFTCRVRLSGQQCSADCTIE